MKKILFLAAGVMMTASAAFAQTANGSDATATATATIGGIFVPKATGTVTTIAGAGNAVPASTPTPQLAAPSGAPASVAQALTGSLAAVAQVTASLTTAGIPSAAAQGIGNALAALGGGNTVGNVSAALSAWNAAIQSLSPAQVVALMNTSVGRSAFSVMGAAHRNAVWQSATRGNRSVQC